MLVKGCPRCNGMMYVEYEGRDRELVCLHCGRRAAVKVRPAAKIVARRLLPRVA